ncbi:hypothetical protein GCM10009105_13820 [Dokdonella soli]|uniref:Uncharacterized protein n=1 Tax=Dokdonella soli TaxID=529810 RepID=A0ABP3TLE4_9GAMM
MAGRENGYSAGLETSSRLKLIWRKYGNASMEGMAGHTMAAQGASLVVRAQSNGDRLGMPS